MIDETFLQKKKLKVFQKQENKFFQLDGKLLWVIMHKICSPQNTFDYLTEISAEAFRLYVYFLEQHNHKVHDGSFALPLRIREKDIMDRFEITDKRTLRKRCEELVKAGLIRVDFGHCISDNSHFYLDGIFQMSQVKPNPQETSEEEQPGQPNEDEGSNKQPDVTAAQPNEFGVNPYDESVPVPF